MGETDIPVDAINVKKLLVATCVVGVFLVIGGLLMGLSIRGEVGDVSGVLHGSSCRAAARTEWDDLRDKRDNLFSDGLIALAAQDQEAATKIAERLLNVRKEIKALGSLQDLYKKNNC